MRRYFVKLNLRAYVVHTEAHVYRSGLHATPALDITRWRGTNLKKERLTYLYVLYIDMYTTCPSLFKVCGLFLDSIFFPTPRSPSVRRMGAPRPYCGPSASPNYPALLRALLSPARVATVPEAVSVRGPG